MRGTALILWAWALSGCSGARCGAGTHEVTAADGTRECVADNPGGIPCDLDGGTVEIVGGLCESRIKCDPSLFFDPITGVCAIPETWQCTQPCPTPVPAGKVCVTGGVVDFQTNMHVMGGASSRPLRIGIYEPLAFLNNPNTPPLAEEPSTTNGCFTFTVTAPSSNQVVIAIQDPVGTTPAFPLAVGGSGASIVAGTRYSVDAYLVLQSTLDSYAAVNPALKSAGTYVACYYNQPPPALTNLIFNETMPTAGVHLLKNGVMPAEARYLKADGTIDTTLTATGAVRGCAITTGSGAITGSGGGVSKWEMAGGGTAANTVFVERFHSCDNAPAGTPTCQ